MTADHEVVTAEVLLTVKLYEPEAAKFAGNLKDRRALSRWDLSAMIRDEIVAAVLVPEIAARNAADLRGNRGLAQSLASQAQAHLEPRLRAKGLFLMSCVINWGLSDSEKVEIGIRRGELQEKAIAFSHQRRVAELRRDLEIQNIRIANLHELKRADAEGDERLKELLLAGELHREGMLDGRRISVARVDGEIRTIQLETEKREAELRLEIRRSEESMRLDVEDRQWRQGNQKRLAEIDADDKEMASMVRMQIQMATAKHDREMAARRMEQDTEFRKMQSGIDARFEERKIRLQEDLARMGQIKDILAAGIGSGAVNADVLKTFLSESTRQSYGTTSDEKAGAMFDAEKARNNLDTFKDAEDRERQQQRDMTRLSSEMMGAAKQAPAPAVVIAPGASPSPVAMPQPAAPLPAAASDPNDPAIRLAKLKKLRDQGLIDEDEFKTQKAAILREI